MKICIVIPDEDYVLRAGARIRYKRIESILNSNGHQLVFLPIGKFRKPRHDVYLLSKCFDASAIVIAQMASSRGKVVGVDIFDDYFSDMEDSRFQATRFWLDSLMPWLDFVLCSTPAMARLFENNSHALPVHVMNDPYENFEPDALRSVLQKKRQDLQAGGVLKVAWFGMGDNPYFRVGLTDLVAISDELAELADGGQRVQLEIMTNEGALSPQVLASLSRIPVPYTLSIWSEEAEARLLERSHLAILPVSTQKFSIAKSLNRAVTAICSGTQVLSLGFPLYERLGSLVYRDIRQLGKDLQNGNAALGEQHLALVAETLKQNAAPEVEAEELQALLTKLQSCKQNQKAVPGPSRARVAIVHGAKSSRLSRKFASRNGIPQIVTPLSNVRKAYQIRFRWNRPRTGFELMVTERAARLMPPEIAERGKRRWKPLKGRMRVFSPDNIPSLASHHAILEMSNSPSVRLALYTALMPTIIRETEKLFPGITCVVSENWRLPWLSPIAGRFSSRREL